MITKRSSNEKQYDHYYRNNQNSDANVHAIVLIAAATNIAEWMPHGLAHVPNNFPIQIFWDCQHVLE